jgi:hypothetical protein
MRRATLSAIVVLMVVAAVTTYAPVALWAQQPKIALLDSRNTRDFFEKHYPACGPPSSYYLGADEYQRYFRGWEWVLIEEKLPYDVLHDQDINLRGLAKYDLLILSNNALLSDDQTRAVHQWVLRGGHLMATFGSGYKDLVSDPRQIDGYKLQKGGTFGLHQLWHDPVGKLFSTYWLDSGVDVKITRYDGPTKELASNPAILEDILRYGAEANILIRRPVNHPDVLGFLIIENPDWKAPTPAIISTRQGRGLVVYFAFAPEYIVYKELENNGSAAAQGWPVCPDGQDWSGRGDGPKALMVSALHYLLGR